MLVECARIISVHDGQLTVTGTRPAHCARCVAGKGCGGGIIGKLVSRPDQQITLAAPAGVDWQPGQLVQLQVPARVLLSSAAVVYLGPLAGLIIGALCGFAVGRTDLTTAAGAAAGLLAGIAGVARFASGVHQRRLALAVTAVQQPR